MGVRTTAEEKLDGIKENIRNAAKDLHFVLVDGCHGSDEIRPEYRWTLVESHHALMEVLEKLESR